MDILVWIVCGHSIGARFQRFVDKLWSADDRKCRVWVRKMWGTALFRIVILLAGIVILAERGLAEGLLVSDNNTHVDRGASYSGLTFLTATGGTEPYTFTVTTGALPEGIFLASDGTISGATCDGNGNYAVTVNVEDAAANASSSSVKLLVNAAPASGCTLTIAPATLPSGAQSQPYNQILTAAGAAGTVTFTVAGGTLPTGVKLSSSGTLSGMPSAAGTYTVSIVGTDSSGPTGTQNYSIAIAPGAPKLTLTSTASAMSQVGQAYSQTNVASGGTTAYSYSLSAGSLPAGTTINTSTGTVSGAPTAAGAFSYTIKATDSGSPQQTATQTTSGTIIGTPALTLTTAISPTTFSGVGQPIAYSYTVTNSGDVTVTGISVTDANVSAITCLASTLGPGASTICTGTRTTTAADVNATSISSSAAARGTFNGAAVLSAAVNTTVKIDVVAIRQATKSAIQGFMSRRADMLTSTSPDMGRGHDRLTGSMFGGETVDSTPPAALGGPRETETRTLRPAIAGQAAYALGAREALAWDREDLAREGTRSDATRPATNSLGLSGSADEGAGRFAFATSLAMVRAKAAVEQTQKQEETGVELSGGARMGLGSGQAGRSAGQPPMFDVWAQGVFSYHSQDRIDGKRQGHGGILFAGADYVVRPWLLVGTMLQLDWMDDSSSIGGRNADGHGWMAGPYMSAGLTPNIFFDARALWGRSTNQVDPLGSYTDKFETSRALVSAKLTGQWAKGALSFRPSAEVVYFTEQQKAYTSTIGIAIDSQSVSLGRLAVGPEVAYRIEVGSAAIFEPFVGVKGVWDFARTAETTAAGEPVGSDAWRGRLEAGTTLRVPSGLSLRASGAYDGIGDDKFRAWQGRASVVVPLQ